MIERVYQVASHYVMFAPGDVVGIAVSGGADSMALLAVLHELAPRWNLKLRVLHCNHQLRGAESEADEAFVREQAVRRGLPFHSARLEVDRSNLEESAREARRGAFLAWIRQGVAKKVALGHTRSDQAETVLFRILRGTGPTGVAAMRPVTPEGFVRPLLTVSREEVRGFLTAAGIPWREDASNADPRFQRNRLRNELLPVLAREWNPAIEERLATLAELQADEEAAWEAMIGSWPLLDEAIVLNCKEFAGKPRAWVRRAFRRVAEQVRHESRGLDFAHLESIRSLVEGAEGEGRLTLPGLSVERSLGWVRFARQPFAAEPFSIPLKEQGFMILPDGRSLSLEPVDGPLNRYNGDLSLLDADRLPAGCEVRSWRPGDRFLRPGKLEKKKLKTLFQEAGIPLWDRGRWPMITSGDEVLWVERFGSAAPVVVTERTQRAVWVRLGNRKGISR
ncbi:MAG: tRNA lysidine(34) synthetase TilS [Bryobacter sp.]|nr:tRNA lysidine(34) synthetase TilS [Bryobacter sp.]